ncbi:MAG TPA: HAMP domain-containing sensor histidine kinase [Flavobacteriales bacterium]|nr:HAMP domain-containing sensor histidine kinase [Flavobacteriales bacterium]
MHSVPLHLILPEEESSDVELLKKAFIPLNGAFNLNFVTSDIQLTTQIELGIHIAVYVGKPDYLSWQECARRLRQHSPEVIFILISDEESTVSAITQGADLLIRFNETDSLPLIIGSYLKRHSFKKNREVAPIILPDVSGDSVSQLQEKNKELEKINFELDRFVYSASHDLRSPLTSVLGLLNLMREEVKDEGTFHLVALMEESILKLDNTIRDIVAYSRNNRTEIAFEPVRIKPIVDDVINNLRYLDTSEYKINDLIHVQDGSVFPSDRNRLQIILNNLLANAIRYRHPARKPQVFVESKLDGSQVEITVSDNGLGINDQHIDKIFDMFYRTSDTSAGSGLGLYIVKETIKKLNGSIEVSSRVNEGTTFKVVLPLTAVSNKKIGFHEKG